MREHLSVVKFSLRPQDYRPKALPQRPDWTQSLMLCHCRHGQRPIKHQRWLAQIPKYAFLIPLIWTLNPLFIYGYLWHEKFSGSKKQNKESREHVIGLLEINLKQNKTNNHQRSDITNWYQNVSEHQISTSSSNLASDVHQFPSGIRCPPVLLIWNQMSMVTEEREPSVLIACFLLTSVRFAY